MIMQLAHRMKILWLSLTRIFFEKFSKFSTNYLSFFMLSQNLIHVEMPKLSLCQQQFFSSSCCYIIFTTFDFFFVHLQPYRKWHTAKFPQEKKPRKFHKKLVEISRQIWENFEPHEGELEHTHTRVTGTRDDTGLKLASTTDERELSCGRKEFFSFPMLTNDCVIDVLRLAHTL